MLTERDLSSELWLKLEKHYKARLEQRRRENDSDSMDATKTAKQRGRIAEIKEFLALANPKLEEEKD